MEFPLKFLFEKLMKSGDYFTFYTAASHIIEDCYLEDRVMPKGF